MAGARAILVQPGYDIDTSPGVGCRKGAVSMFIPDSLKAQFQEIAKQPVDPVASAEVLAHASAAVERLEDESSRFKAIDPEVADKQVR